ncbi:hypothetical protein J6590_055471 [Homalodisca vitripennis]|nr:hypothetical protein J6590_055471 [Homalodisca vitripennis]
MSWQKNVRYNTRIPSKTLQLPSPTTPIELPPGRVLVRKIRSPPSNLTSHVGSTMDVTSAEAVAGAIAVLPCDLSPPVPGDRVHLVIWYKDSIDLPIYRQKSSKSMKIISKNCFKSSQYKKRSDMPQRKEQTLMDIKSSATLNPTVYYVIRLVIFTSSV